MFSNNKKQFINILQQNKQLKINYKTIQDDKIIKEEQSSFLISSEKLPEDAKFKINSLEKNVTHTYISSLFESPNQYIIETKDVDVISYDSIKIGNSKSIVIPKNEINATKRYFEDTGIDYILSPYTVLEEYLEDNGKKNSLNFLIYNDIIYLLIYNNKKQLTFNKIKVLTSFESTQDESFSEDDIVGQKVYEELNFLEIQQFLTETVEEYYTTGDDVEFLEHIEIIYNIKPLSENQIDLLTDIMMVPIVYKSVSINSYIDEIIQRPDIKIHNFVIPRIKKETSNIYTWIALAIVTVAIGIGVFYFSLDNTSLSENEIKTMKTNKIVKNNETKSLKQKEIVSVDPTVVSLPNHVKNNKMIVQNIQMLFDVIPYNAILKDLEINQKSSTYVANFLATSSSMLDMQTKLKNIYSDSKVLLQHKNKVIENSIIQNDSIKSKYNFNEEIDLTKYTIYKFLSTSNAITYVSSLALKDSIIEFDSKERTSFQTYNFSITSKVNSPKDFFDFIKKLNSQNLSIELHYPVTFSKTTDYLEIKYNIKVHQQLKKQVQTIK